jgi:tRNA1(Val) A37 N6-methylase TrmN6
VPDIRVQGIEIAPELVRLGCKNASRNQMADRVRFAQGDVENLELELFDHVFFNPPFHPDTGQVSPLGARDQAMRDRSRAVSRWTRVAVAAARARGTVTAIVRADRQHEIIDAVMGRGATILPLFPRMGEAPKRVIVRIEKGSDETFRIAGGLVLHLADGRPTPEADAVLRHAAALAFA